MGGTTIWTDQNIRDLREMWTQGKSTKAIGTAIGVTKNAVVGKGRRLGLAPRPSPLRPLGSGKVPFSYRPATPRQLAHPDVPVNIARRSPPEPLRPVVRVIPPSPLLAVLPTPAPIRLSPVRSCCWPIGEPRDRANFRFCGDPIGGRQSYCEVHHRMAHSRPMRLADLAADTGRPANSSHILDSL